MPFQSVYTVEEQRALVYEYLQVPYGSKAKFLVARKLTHSCLRRWRSQVFADTLEYGLVPRSGGSVSIDESGSLKRLLTENQQLRDELAAREVAHRKEVAARDQELACQRRAVDALGKAIEILHPHGVSKNSPSDAANDLGHRSPASRPGR